MEPPRYHHLSFFGQGNVHFDALGIRWVSSPYKVGKRVLGSVPFGMNCKSIVTSFIQDCVSLVVLFSTFYLIHNYEFCIMNYELLLGDLRPRKGLGN